LFSAEFLMPKHITEPETWSVWSGDIEWEGEEGEGVKADFRPFALFNGKRWGIIHPRTNGHSLLLNPGLLPTSALVQWTRSRRSFYQVTKK
jgi:hypothetical protein